MIFKLVIEGGNLLRRYLEEPIICLASIISFTVAAPRSAVQEFHRNKSVLKKLTPPPLIIQIHNFESLGEGSVATFTIWFGFFPVHWKVVHSDVGEKWFYRYTGFAVRSAAGSIPTDSWLKATAQPK